MCNTQEGAGEHTARLHFQHPLRRYAGKSEASTKAELQRDSGDTQDPGCRVTLASPARGTLRKELSKISSIRENKQEMNTVVTGTSGEY